MPSTASRDGHLGGGLGRHRWPTTMARRTFPRYGAKTSQLLRGRLGSSAGLWLVGNGGTILRHDRNGWANASIMTPVPTNAYYSIWGQRRG